jgi:hypothetical protein
LRQAVIDGTGHMEGAAALRYHGMLKGLLMLTQAGVPRNNTVPLHEPAMASQPAGEFVHLLANLVLRTHWELTHVY